MPWCSWRADYVRTWLSCNISHVRRELECRNWVPFRPISDLLGGVQKKVLQEINLIPSWSIISDMLPAFGVCSYIYYHVAVDVYKCYNVSKNAKLNEITTFWLDNDKFSFYWPLTFERSNFFVARPGNKSSHFNDSSTVFYVTDYIVTVIVGYHLYVNTVSIICLFHNVK